VFLINSCLGLFTATGLRRHFFFRSYGVILPSSLTTCYLAHLRILSLTTSVWFLVQGHIISLEVFLGSLASNFATRRAPTSSHFSLIIDRGFTNVPAFVLSPQSNNGLLLSFSVTTSHAYGYGNINPLSIGYAFRPRLRSRLTLGGRTLPRKP
jgi:hypothetical protein